MLLKTTIPTVGWGGGKNNFSFIFLLIGSIVSGMTSFSFVMLLKTTIPGWVGGWPGGWPGGWVGGCIT